MTAFAVLTVALDEQIPDRPDLAPLLLLILVLLAVGDLVAYVIIRQSMMTRLRSLLDQGSELAGLTPGLTVLWIIPAAMAEGLGLLAIVIFLLTGNAFVLAAAAAALLILLGLFPTRDRVAQFLSSLHDRPFGQ